MFHSLEGAAAEQWTQVWKRKICSHRNGAFWPLSAQQAPAGSFGSRGHTRIPLPPAEIPLGERGD